MDQYDASEPDAKKLTPEQIKEAVRELSRRKGMYQGYLKELEESGETQLLLTDPEARRMHSKDGFHCCYNVQAAVDGGSHLIAEYEVTNHNTDQGLLKEVAQSAKELLETGTIEAVADKGYESRADILECVMNGIVPNVAMKYDKEERVYALEYEPVDITEDERASTVPGDIQRCIRAGVLPKCYEGTAVQVEVREQCRINGFLRGEDGTVTCPCGHRMTLLKTRGGNTVYANKDACRQCSLLCTGGKGFKTASFGPGVKAVPVRLYGRTEEKVNRLPEGTVLYNSFWRRDHAHRQVMVRIRPDPKKLKERMCLSEHPFGTVKWYRGGALPAVQGKRKSRSGAGAELPCVQSKTRDPSGWSKGADRRDAGVTPPCFS